MVNKKLMTSLFNVKFKLFKDGCTRFEDADGNILTNPLPQYRYITDRVVHPKRTVYDDYPDLIYAGTTHDDLLVYTYDWSTDGVTPWNFTDDIVEKDIELTTCNWVEKKWKIEFELVPTGNLVIDSACTKEALPPTIENISNGKTVTSTAANNYASDYTKNRFKYSTTGSDLHYVLRNATGNSCRWIDQYGQPFYFGTTKVYKDLRLHMDWIFKTWALTIDYNTGSNRYSNDLTADYIIKSGSTNIGTYSKTANAIITKYVEDNFTVNTSPTQASSISFYLNNITSRFSGASITSNVKITNWYNEMGRSSIFDRANFKFTAPKTIYAKWVNTEDAEYFRTASGPNYGSQSEMHDVWYSVASTYTTPSFCPVLKCEVMGAGGNSNQQRGCRATGSNYFEVAESTPGGNATKSDLTLYDVVADSSKYSFDWLALGCESSYDRSYIKRGSWEVKSYRGASGGGYSEAGRNLCNVGDADDESKPITDGSRSVLGFFANKLSKGGQNVYTKDVNTYSSRKNTGTKTLYLFRGYSDPNHWQAKDKVIWCYLQAYFYCDPGWKATSAEYYFGKYIYGVTGSDNSNNDKYGWYPSIASNQEVRYVCQGNQQPGREFYGKGGQAIYATSRSDSDAKKEYCLCYGSGGYVRFYFPAQ